MSQSSETPATNNASMMSPFPTHSLMSLQQPLLIKLESGTAKIDRNYLEFKFLDCSASVFALLMMVKALFLAGLTARSEHSYLSQASFFLLLMTLTITVAPQSPQHLTDSASFQEEPREKLEFGRSLSKNRLWKCLLRSIDQEYGQFK